jgi:hypothetical protein
MTLSNSRTSDLSSTSTNSATRLSSTCNVSGMALGSVNNLFCKSNKIVLEASKLRELLQKAANVSQQPLRKDTHDFSTANKPYYDHSLNALRTNNESMDRSSQRSRTNSNYPLQSYCNSGIFSNNSVAGTFVFVSCYMHCQLKVIPHLTTKLIHIICLHLLYHPHRLPLSLQQWYLVIKFLVFYTSGFFHRNFVNSIYIYVMQYV